MQAVSRAPLNKSLALMASDGLAPYACECKWLERAANDPSVPIGFDAEVNEYYLKTTDDLGRMIIQFCPWCGGDAPSSHRDSLFAVVTVEEMERLRTLFATLRTREDVVKLWGPCDEEIRNGFSDTPAEADGKPGRTVTYDVLRYNNISSMADIDVIVCPGDRVMFSYNPKPARNEG